MGNEVIFHIASANDWADAELTGQYRRSTIGYDLAEVGFIHCSFRDQVELVGRLHYSDVKDDLVVLVIDPARLEAEVRLEDSDGNGVVFPHIYGPLPTEAVIAILPARAGSDAGADFTVSWVAETPPPDA